MRVASEAEARRFAHAAGQKFPKPVPVNPCKRHRWSLRKLIDLRSPTGFVKACAVCGASKKTDPPRWAFKRRALPPRSKPIRQFSKKSRKRIGEWSALRDGIIARDGGVCLFCGGRHEKNTAHHVVPRGSGGPDVETNLATIGITFRGFGGCHQAAHNDLRSSKLILLRKLAEIYGVEKDARLAVVDDATAYARALGYVQTAIERGERPSLLGKS